MSSPRDSRTTASTIGGATNGPSSCTGRKASKACAGPAGWRPRRSTSSRRTCVPGVTTGELDKLCHDFILDHKAIPAPLNYRGFPKSICTSINHVVCHGIPGDKRLQNGDIVNIDVTTILDGWYGDTSRMFFVGERRREGAPAVRRHLRGDDARHRGGQARRPCRRHRPRDPDLCRGAALLGGARFLGPRPRPHLPRRAEHPALRQARHRAGAAARACSSPSSRWSMSAPGR